MRNLATWTYPGAADVPSLLRAAAEEGGQPLEAGVRAWLEPGFGADLSGIRLHQGPKAGKLVAAMGVTACATGEGIFAIPAALGTASVAGRLRLAHEVAHVLQARLPWGCEGSHGSAEPAEREASEAAVAACSGVPVPRLHASHPGVPLAWGEAGHYWTVYFLAVAVGMRAPKAHQVAFFAQMPDEVNEFDATYRGKDYVMSGVALGSAAGMGAYGGLGALVDQQMQDLDIQRGLHVLTGNLAAKETALRRAIIAEIHPSSPDFMLELGLSLHPFGDCFAHVKGDRTYEAPLGHLMDWHDPDYINEANRGRYAHYVESLHHVLSARFPGAKPIKTAPECSALLTQLCAMGKLKDDEEDARERRQGARIRQWMATELGHGDPSNYDPLRNAARPFGGFVKDGFARAVGLQPKHLGLVYRLASAWARRARTLG